MNFKDGQGEDETNETNGRFPVGFRSFSSVSLFSFVSSSLLRAFLAIRSLVLGFAWPGH
jgi:hypothetical protein